MNETLKHDNDTLIKDNDTLTKDNKELRDQNARLYNDLSTAIPTIHRIKAHLDIIQSQVGTTSSPSDELEANVEQLQHDWADVDRDFTDIYKRYKKKNGHAHGHGQEKIGRIDSVVGFEEGSRESSPEIQHRSRIIIRRGGLVRRIDKEVSFSGSGSGSEDSSEGEDTLGETLVGELWDEARIMKEGDEKGIEDEKHDQVTTVSHETEEEGGTTKASKTLTPWQELMDSIAEFAGWHSAYEE